MPGKNKPKRLDRNNSWRVQRRKKKRRELAAGGGRNRKPRPKKNKTSVETVKSVIEKKVADSKPEIKKVVKKTAAPKGVPSKEGKTVSPKKAEEILSKVAKDNGKKE